MLKTYPNLTTDEVQKGIDESLERWTTPNLPLYGIFYKGKMVNISKARVYYQKGRAKRELLNKFKYSIYLNGIYRHGHSESDVKDYIDSLLRDGTLEIKQI